MNHYSPEDWVDFARNLAASGLSSSMRDHLDSGCPACEAVFSRLQLAGQAIRTGEAAVPSATLRRAYAIYSGLALETRRRPLHLIAKLWFDSFAEQAPQGVRATHDGTRQLSYRVGDLRVDVAIEELPKDKLVTITGQIHGDPERRQNLPVRLLAAERVVAEGVTSEFGEFVLTVIPKKQMQLSIVEPGDGTKIVIPLPDSIRAGIGGEMAKLAR